jgi:endonuclease YncB( thermonuclease family)
MAFLVIKGTFHVVGYSPDGDSIRFQADNEANWAKLAGPPVTLNARRHAQLRLEAIDTMETHYRNTQQPLTLATRALDFLLQGLGITGVQWDVLRTRVTEANDGTEGYIVSRTVEPNRRPVAFVFAGAPPATDGSSIFLDVDLLRQSLNYQSLAAGLAYPTYYKGLFSDLRAELTEASTRARQASLEIWAEDRTNTGFAVEGLESISEEHVILPKLFRRLAEYLEVGGSVVGFKEFLESRAEGITIISTAHFTHFDTVVEVGGNVVRMTEPPENLVFEG